MAEDVTREAARSLHGSLNRKPDAASAKEQTAPSQSCATRTVLNTERSRQSFNTLLMILTTTVFNNSLNTDLILKLCSHIGDNTDYGIFNIENNHSYFVTELWAVSVINLYIILPQSRILWKSIPNRQEAYNNIKLKCS